jgi:hypothetical protein
MPYDLKIVSRNSNENTTIKIKTENLESLHLDIKFTDDKEKINDCLINDNEEKIYNCSINDSELLWRSEVLKIIRGI